MRLEGGRAAALFTSISRTNHNPFLVTQMHALTSAVCGAFLVTAATAPGATADSTGSYWIKTCAESAPKNAKCIGYLSAIRDLNEMLTEVFDRPLWCAPKSVTVGQLRHVIVSALVAAPPSRLKQPFAASRLSPSSRASPAPQRRKIWTQAREMTLRLRGSPRVRSADGGHGPSTWR